MVRPAGFEQRVFVVTTLSSTTSPTATQINAGIEISADMPAPINYSGTQNYIDTSPLQQQDTQQAGTIAIDNLEFEIYRHKATAQLAYDALPNNAVRYIVKFEGGNAPASGAIIATNVCDVAVVTVGIKTDVSSPRNDSRRVKVPVALNEAIAWRSVVA